MKKYRISTTISEGHWELLKKHIARFGTQQKVLELAIEKLEGDSKKDTALSPEEEIWMRIGKEIRSACTIQRDLLKILIDAANLDEWLPEYIASQKPMVYVIEFYYQRPLKKCSLKEIVEGITINCRASNWFDKVNYIENGDHYLMAISHSLNLKSSKVMMYGLENLFNTYGVKTESEISGRSIFIKIYKSINSVEK